MYLCEVAIVSQLCISFPYILHGLCEDYLTCDIAFNAVMPLSHASTRGRYSRIEGVTLRKPVRDVLGQISGLPKLFNLSLRDGGSHPLASCSGHRWRRLRTKGRTWALELECARDG